MPNTAVGKKVSALAVLLVIPVFPYVFASAGIDKGAMAAGFVILPFPHVL
jgi:hypothetical protein